MNPSNVPHEPPQQSFIQRNIRLGVWGATAGAVIGSTAWLIAMAGLNGDWLAFSLTVGLDIVVLVVIARLCLRLPRSRFLLLAIMLTLLTAHCLTVYWWRLDLWRADRLDSAAELTKQKTVVTLTVGAMVGLLIGQLLVMQWLQKRGKLK